MIKYLLSLTMLASLALAAPSELDRAILSPTRNILQNPGFESGKAAWVASGGTFTIDTSNIGTGNDAGSWDSNAASQTFTSLQTIPQGLYGRNGYASCNFKCASGTCTHTLTVDDGSGNNFVSPVTIYSSSTYKRTSVNFVFPTSGSARLKISSVASNEPTVYVDDCILSEATNVTQVNVTPIIWTGYHDSTCAWSTTSTSPADPSDDASCGFTEVQNLNMGTVSSYGSKKPGITFTPPVVGRYLVCAGFSGWNNTNNVGAAFDLYDGTSQLDTNVMYNTSGTNSNQAPFKLCGYYNATSTASSVSIRVRMSAISSGTTNLSTPTSNTHAVDWLVELAPATTQTAYKPDQAPALWSGYHDSDCNFTRANSAYGDQNTDSTCTFTETQNLNFGTVSSHSSGGNKLPGIVVTWPYTGKFNICAMADLHNSATNGNNGIRLTDGTTVISAQHDRNPNGTGAAELDVVLPLCGIYSGTAGTTTTFNIQTKSDAGAGSDIGSASGSHAVEWTLFGLTQNFPAPVLVGSVTSNATGAERVERARIANAGSCSITGQSGTWISTISRPAAGRCLLTFATGEYSAAPYCTCSLSDGTLNNETAGFCSVSTTSTQADIKQATAAGGGTVGDSGFDIICMGPR